MSVAAVEPGTTSADPGSAAVPAGAVAEVARNLDEAEGADGDAGEILARLDAFESGDSEPLESAVDHDTTAQIRKGDEPAADKVDAAPEDEDAKTIREINARSLARRKAKEAARRPASAAATPTPAVTAAAAAAKAADAAAAAPKTPAAGAPSNEVADAVRDVLAQIERLAGEDEKAAAATAAGAVDKGADTRAAELKSIRETVGKIAEGLNETGVLKTSIEELQKQLKDQAEDAFVRRRIADEIDAVADLAPTVASNARHSIQIEENGVKKTVRMTGVEIVHHQAVRFYQKYKTAPDLKELAKRIEKKLAGTSPEKTGEKTTTPRKTVSTSQSSPPAARQGPDKRSGKEAEHDFFKRLGMSDEIRD